MASRTVTSSAYDPLLRGLINAHKERQALGLTPVLGRLGQSVRVLLSARGVEPGTAVMLVPVPSARRAVRERGFDATAALARTAARRLRADYRASVVPGLVQVPGVRDQSGLDARAGRPTWPAASACVAGPDRPVVLVDDLVTTGSSLTEAARVLRRAGVAVLGAATVAATARRGGKA